MCCGRGKGKSGGRRGGRSRLIKKKLTKDENVRMQGDIPRTEAKNEGGSEETNKKA